MKNQYKKLQNTPRKLTSEEEEKVGQFLWANFWLDFKAPNLPRQDLIKDCLARLIYNQAGDDYDPPSGEYSYLTSDDIKRYATHLYASIQLMGELNEIYAKSEDKEYAKAFRESPYLPKAMTQINPYILRYHVFALHNRMHALMMDKKIDSKDWQARLSCTYKEAQETKEKLLVLKDQHPAFGHFLLGYNHYTQAMGADAEHSHAHFREAYLHFLYAEATENKKPKASFLVNLGQGLYKDMPFDNLEPVKQQLEARFTQNEIHELKSKLENLMSNRKTM